MSSVLPRRSTADATRDPEWTCAFNRAAFHALNAGPWDEVLRLEHDEDGRPVGALSGVLRDGTLTCGHSAPFGGVDLARPRETPARIAATVDATLAAAAAAGAHTVRVRCRPDAYGTNEPGVLFALLNRGFRVESADLAYVLDLAATPTAAAYVAALKSPARRALKHLTGVDPRPAHETGGPGDRTARSTDAPGERIGGPWSFRPATDDADWRAAHALLSANRAAKGRRLALNADYVLHARAALPGVVRMFVLEHDGRPCAAALVYVVAPGAWYVVAWGDAGHDLPRSPMNLLALRTVEAALADGARLLDLGVSSVPDGDGLAIDPGLAQFKTSILARPQTRLTLVR